MSSNPVYSFYNERLRTHVEHALRVFDENSRLVRYGLSLKKTFYTLLKYTIILHDFGKVPYNQTLWRSKSRDKLSFEGHEVLSAWFADKYLAYAIDNGIIDVDYGDVPLVVLAILLHHHPMNLSKRADRLRGNKDIRINRQTIDLFYNELEGIITPVYQLSLKSDQVSGADIVNEVLERRGIFHSYWSSTWMNGDAPTRKTFLLLAQGLIAADYRSASLTRGEGVSEFANAIQVYLSYYGSAGYEVVPWIK